MLAPSNRMISNFAQFHGSFRSTTLIKKKVLSWFWDRLLSFQHLPDKDSLIILAKLITNVLTSERKHRSISEAKNIELLRRYTTLRCRKCLRMRRDKYHVVDFQQSHWLRVKIPSKCLKKWQLFLSRVVLWFCRHCERSRFWSKFSVICVVWKIMHPATVRQTHWWWLKNDPFDRDRRCDCWMREGDMPKKVGNFLVLCLVQVSCNSV